MSTAQEIIEDAYASIGRGSEILSIDSTLLSAGLNWLITCMETLRKNDIILEETVSDVTTTIAVPSSLSDELDEPAAARGHLVNYLAVHLASISRVNPADITTLPSARYSMEQLGLMYREHSIPNKEMSTLMPRGQGHKGYRSQGVYFNGEALDNDASES